MLGSAWYVLGRICEGVFLPGATRERKERDSGTNLRLIDWLLPVAMQHLET
jgi:hypothetical protein